MFIQQSLPDAEIPQSDLDGLNLNIFVPQGKEADTSNRDLPVLVFIHGGGYFFGAGSWPQYDFTRVVKLSEELGKPMIGVSIK